MASGDRSRNLAVSVVAGLTIGCSNDFFHVVARLLASSSVFLLRGGLSVLCNRGLVYQTT